MSNLFDLKVYFYCKSFYGAQAWNFRDKHIDDLLKAWIKRARYWCKL